MQPRVYFLQKAIDGNRNFLLPMAVSLICHLIFFAAVVFTPRHFSSRKFLPTVVNVNLVTLPPIATAPVSQGSAFRGTESQIKKHEKASVPKTPPKTDAGNRKKPSNTVSVAPKKWAAKTSLKERTFKPSQVVKKAIRRIEEKTEESRPSPIAEAIGRLKDKVGGQEATNRLKQTAEPGGVLKPGMPTGKGIGGKTAPEILVYQQQIAYYIRNNWVYTEQLGGQQTDLECRLMIKIMPNGEIKDIWFEKRSGNRYLDDSAYKAVMKSNPLPALPKGYRFYSVLLGFTPSGLQ